METTDAPVPIQVLEKCYELFHGPLPNAYTKAKSRLDESLARAGAPREDVNRALTAELYQYIPKPLFIMLEEEYRALHGKLPDGYPTEKEGIIARAGGALVETEADTVDPEAGKAKLHQLNDDLVSAFYRYVPKAQAALCLSGGGIRSATFGLGVLQALARYGLLDQFHYLSTVSGGGYVGSWLTSWMYRKEQQQPGKGLESVINELAQPRLSKLDPEAPPIQHLRQYSNFLTPKLGWLSADTWTLIATYFRNLFINWLVWLPLLLATLMVPRLVASVATYTPHANLWDVKAAFAIGFVLAGVAMAYINLSLPSMRSLIDDDPEFLKKWQGQGVFLYCCLFPLVLSAFLLTSAWAWLANSGMSSPLLPFNTDASAPDAFKPWKSLKWFLLIGAAAHVLGWGITAGVLIKTGGPKRIKQIWQNILELFRLNWKRTLGFCAGSLLIILISGLVGGSFAWLIATQGFPNPVKNLDYYGTFAVPLLLLSFLMAGVMYVALASRWTTDEDREWWSRSSAWILIAVLGWTAGMSIVVFGPLILFRSSTYGALLSGLGGLSGLIALFLGHSAVTADTNAEAPAQTKTDSILKWAPVLAAPIAIIYVLVALAYVTSLAIQAFPWLLCSSSQDPCSIYLDISHNPDDHLTILSQTNGRRLLPVLIAVAGIGLLFSGMVNVNKFSLHSIYRNRLIRAYLGASRERRRPDPFTGFDPKDNIQMHALVPPVHASKPSERRLLHVINIALNLVQQKQETLAWQERKAESFTMSALHAGSWRLGYRSAAEYGQNRKNIAVRLGTAVAISGAAASPNMGYHSSAPVTFLMTLFNLRLGWWMGNPGAAGNDTFNQSCPVFAIKPILDEAFGFTNDENPYVYLSDGGHFENLGLYEMVLRRCRFILVIDAGHDPDCAFDDLGNAVRKVRVDLGVPITFKKKICIYPRKTPRSADQISKYCAVATIEYSRLDSAEPDGTLIYLKPALCEGEPADVYNYAQTNPAFPHEPTSDQWFSESQFESYRMLGSHILGQMCGEEEVWKKELKKWKLEGPAGWTNLDVFQSQIDGYLTRAAAGAASASNGAEQSPSAPAKPVISG